MLSPSATQWAAGASPCDETRPTSPKDFQPKFDICAARLAQQAFDTLEPKLGPAAFLDVLVQGSWRRMYVGPQHKSPQALTATQAPEPAKLTQPQAVSRFLTVGLPVVRHRKVPQNPSTPSQQPAPTGRAEDEASLWAQLFTLASNLSPATDHALALPLSSPSGHVLAVAVWAGVPAHLTPQSTEVTCAKEVLGHALALMEPHLWAAALTASKAQVSRLESGLQLVRRANKRFNACTTHGKVAYTLGRLLLDLGPHIEAAAVRISPLHNQRGCSALCHREAATQEAWRATAAGHMPALAEALGPSRPPVPLRLRGRTVGDVHIWHNEMAPAPSSNSSGGQDFLLTDLVQMAADALERVLLQQEAQLSATMRENFLSVASHELRTPLTALNLQLENLARLVRRHCDKAVVDKLTDKMARAFRQTGRLSQLLDNLLDVMTLRSGTIHVATTLTQVKDFLRTTLARWTQEARKAGCEFTVHCPDDLTGMWDGYRMAQVLDHLLANAIKYGAGRPIDLTVDHTDTEILLTLKDSGIGVPPEVSERIFGAFERAVSPREFGGLGLGLFLSRGIVEAHGGRMRVTPGKTCGSQFHIALPKASTATAQS